MTLDVVSRCRDTGTYLGKVSPTGSFPVRTRMQGSPSRSSYVSGTQSSLSPPRHAYTKAIITLIITECELNNINMPTQ